MKFTDLESGPPLLFKCTFGVKNPKGDLILGVREGQGSFTGKPSSGGCLPGGVLRL